MAISQAIVIRGLWMLAESGSDYSWIIYLVFFFFVFMAPILKKVADALGLTKQQPPQRGLEQRRRDLRQRAPQKGGVLGGMLGEVEDFFRKARADGNLTQESSGQKAAPPRKYSAFDMQYRKRKQEAEERQRRRDEQRRGRRVGAMESPKPQPPRPELVSLKSLRKELLIKPVIEPEPEGLVIIEEPQEKRELSSLVKKKKKRKARPVHAREDTFFEVLGELPELARMVVMSEIVSPPKGMQG